VICGLNQWNHTASSHPPVIQKEREQVTIVNNVPESKCAEHPVLLAFPESYYLKCLFLQKIS